MGAVNVIRMTLFGTHLYVVGFTELMNPTWSEYQDDAAWYSEEEAKRISDRIYNGRPLEIVDVNDLNGEPNEA